MANTTDTLVTYPGSYDSTNYAYASVNSSYPLSNPVGKSSSNTTYAQWNLKTGSSAESYVFYLFDCSSIPETATIESVTCSAKAYINSTNSSRINTRQMQLYCGTNTAKGSASTVSTSASAQTLTCGTWSREELDDCRIRIYTKRGTSSTTSTYYNRFYGATLTVTYTYNNVTYTVTSSAVNGTIEPNGESVVSEGSSLTFKMEPTSNEPFTSLTVNGTSVQPTLVTNSGITNGVYFCSFDTSTTDELTKASVSNNGCSISTANAKFGSSLYLNGSSYLTINLDQAYSNNVTVEFWFYTDQARDTSGVYPTLFSTNTTNGSGGTYVHVDDSSYSTYPVCRCNASGSGNNGAYGSTVITRGVWHHFAYCRDGSSNYYFLDGSLIATVTQSSPFDVETVYIGGMYNGSGMTSGCYFTGYIDDFLVSNVSKYTSAFSVPTSAYTIESETYYEYTLSNIGSDTTVVVVFGGNETFLMKVNGNWVEVTQVYKKINGVWVEQSDLSSIFDSDIKYIKKQ